MSKHYRFTTLISIALTLLSNAFAMAQSAIITPITDADDVSPFTKDYCKYVIDKAENGGHLFKSGDVVCILCGPFGGVCPKLKEVDAGENEKYAVHPFEDNTICSACHTEGFHFKSTGFNALPPNTATKKTGGGEIALVVFFSLILGWFAILIYRRRIYNE